MKDTKKKLYTEKKWYINNYNSLGSSWLINSIKAIKPQKEFRFANLSANAGYYEKDTYIYYEDLKPIFYLGDMFAESLADPRVNSFSDFIYLEGQRDACDVSLEMLDNKKVDILLDCKGALWYALRLGYASEEDALSLLRKYRELLGDEGILLVDYYDFNEWNSLWFEVTGGNRKKKTLSCFGECSTKKHLQDVFGNKFVKENCKELVISPDESYPLSTKMGTATISVESIDIMIDRLQNDRRIHKKYKNRRIVKILINNLPRVLLGLLVIYIVYTLLSVRGVRYK